MKERKNKILELLSEQNKVEVTFLSETLGVSQVTIRKDLDALESQGIIKREHGFALLRSTDDINGRIAYHYEEKRQIAKAAAELVKDGDTIMIESGSCCALLADELSRTKKDLTIITNSAFIASYIRGKSNFQIFLLGGIYQQDSQVMVGPMVRQGAENFFVENFFIGTDGYSSQIGFTNRDQMRAQAVRDMALQSSQVIVLTESEKFKKIGVVPLNLKDKVKMVITDSHISEETNADLISKGILIQYSKS
jgi:DeoR/GlpR family transcriptional regulator of sugar metabolism